MAERELAGDDLLLYRGTTDAVVSATVSSGGTGYTSAPTVTIAAPNRTKGVRATATATIASGAVTAITITNMGSGYTSAPAITFSGGGGSGAAATSVLGTTQYNLVACLTSNNINQGSNVISADTKCGTKKLPGTSDATIAFDIVALLDPDGNKISLAALQADYKMQAEVPWKIKTADGASGDPIFSFNAYLSEYNIDASPGAHTKANGTLQCDDNGVEYTTA